MVESGTLLKGRYRLKWRLGQGTFGEVWFATDEQTRREVAIKVMLSTHSDPTVHARCEREALMATRLRHPGIARVYEAGWHGPQLYIVMELLQGPGDLAKVMTANLRGLPVTRAADLAIQVADALSSVHAAKIIHRDIKPANLFVQYGDAIKILDFGVARDPNHWATITQPGQALGTPAYMAPELWEGGTWASEASDLYALGCVLYEMLTGQPPFAGRGSYLWLLQRHKNETPRPPSAYRADVPRVLDSLVLELLAKSPGERSASAAEVAGRLRDGERSAGHEPRDPPELSNLATIPRTIPDAAGHSIRPAPAGPVWASATVACASVSGGHLEVFILDGSDRIGRCRRWPESGRADWLPVSMPGTSVSAVAAGSHDEDHVELAAVAEDTVYHRRWMNGQSSGWDAMPPLRTKIVDVAFASMIPGRLEIFVLDNTGKISYRGWPEGNGWWSPWQDMASPDRLMVTAVAAGSHSGEHEEFFAITDGTVWHKSWSRAADGSSDWSEWRQVPLPGSPAVDLACTSSRTGHLALFALNIEGEVYSRSHSRRAGWSGWEGVSAPGGRQVTAVAAGWDAGSQQAALLAITGDGTVRCGQSRLEDIGRPVWTWRDIAT